MRATNLTDVLNIFDPRRSLTTREELDAYFVERQMGILATMETYLKNMTSRSKLLFTGHRGSGKSTELNRLVLNIEDQFFIIKFSITESLDPFDLNYIDIVLTCALKLLERAVKEEVEINRGILTDVFDWLQNEITEERVIESSMKGGLMNRLNLFLLKIEGKLGKEVITRVTMRRKIGPRFSELVDKINLIIREIEEKTSKEVLIIIEDLDKTDLDRADKLFFQHGRSISSIHSKIIYTFPIALRYSGNFAQISRTFDDNFILPNITIFDKRGNNNPRGEEILREAILKRMEEHLIEEETIREVIRLSGGVILELIILIQKSANYALTYKKTVIDQDIIKRVVREIQNDYRIMLREEQYEILKMVNGDEEKKRIVNDRIGQELLHNLSLLEYRNDEVWVDVHPIVRHLL
ncbi:MAG: hypothetical protein ACE5EA_08695 [Nitrospirota bacterium]